MNGMINFYSSLEDVYSPTRTGSSPLLSADGIKLIEKKKILERWAEHYDGVLNRPSAINKAVERLLQVPVNESFNVPPILREVQIAICQVSSSKIPGSDSIPAEIYKEGGSALMGKRLTIIQFIWVKEQLLQDFKDASIIHIYKPKTEATGMRSPRKLLTFNIRQDHYGQSLSESSQQSSWTWTLTGQTMWLPQGRWDCWHDVRCNTAPREVYGTEHWPLLDLYWYDHGIWPGQRRRLLENHGKLWLPRKFHHQR